MGSKIDRKMSDKLSVGSASRLRVVDVASFDSALERMCLRRALEALRVFGPLENL